MRYVAAYLLASLSGTPTNADLEKILGSVGIEVDDDKLNQVMKSLSGKDLAQVIETGRGRLGSVPTGGGAVAAAPVAGGGGGGGVEAAAPEAVEEEKKEEKKDDSDDGSGSDDDMGFGLFD